jgi:hypothetical protein
MYVLLLRCGVCTSVRLLPSGETPIAVINNNNNNSRIFVLLLYLFVNNCCLFYTIVLQNIVLVVIKRKNSPLYILVNRKIMFHFITILS